MGATVAAAGFAASASGASAIEVNTLADPGNGNCNDGLCTLREAVALANSNPDASTITFQAGLTGTINLNPTSGQLLITAPVTIQGPGASRVRVSGDEGNPATFSVRPFAVTAGPSAISGLTIADGVGRATSASTDFPGGLIYHQDSALTLDGVVLTDGYTFGEPGGAIYSLNGSLTITNSTIADSSAIQAGTDGGGIASEDGTLLSIRNSTISANIAVGEGGGVFSNGTDAVEIADSTISGNAAVDAPSVGGGLSFSATGGSLSITNSTFSGNAASAQGGGMNLRTGTMTISNSTIAGNSLTSPASPGDSGGIRRSGTNNTTISSSIIADNLPTDLGSAVIANPVTVGNSLVEVPSATGSILESPLGSNLTGVDPQLGPLAANGGPTLTQAVPPTSPAIDKGVANGLAIDQRGLPRTSGAGTDIGAFELQVDAAVDSPNVFAKKSQKVKGSKIKVVVNAGAGEAVDLSANGTVSPPRKKGKGRTALKGKKPVALERVSGSAAAGATSKLTLVPVKKSAGRKLAKALAKGGKARASVEVVLKDAAGNTDTETVKVTLKGSKKKK